MSIDLAEFAALVWRKKRLVLGVFAFSVALANLLYVLSTPRYEASVLLFMGQNSSKSDNGDKVSTVAEIVYTDDVLRDAISRVGFSRMHDSRSSAIFEELREHLQPGAPESEHRTLASLISSIRYALVVRTEPKADTITISFRDPDRFIAAELVNAVAKALIDRQIALVNRPGATDFFRTQKVKFEEQVKSAAAALAQFSSQTSTYSIDEQRVLLLRRSSELASALASTRNQISERRAQQQALTRQLNQLKPVKQSSYVSGLVDTFGSHGEDVDGKLGKAAGERSASDTPPLLLIRVYQEFYSITF